MTDVVARIDAALEDAARLQLRVSRERCRVSVDDLLSGYGPNPVLCHCSTACDCVRDFIHREPLYLAVEFEREELRGDRIIERWNVRHIAVLRPDGVASERSFTYPNYFDYAWDEGEREACGNVVPPPPKPPRIIVKPGSVAIDGITGSSTSLTCAVESLTMQMIDTLAAVDYNDHMDTDRGGSS